MTPEEAVALVESVLEHRHLSRVENLVLQGVWKGLSYADLAKQAGYDAGYIKNASYKLWQSLSVKLGERVTKHNLRIILQRYTYRSHSLPPLISTPQTTSQLASQAVFQLAPHSILLEPLSAQQVHHRHDWGEAIDVSNFYGRTNELDILDHWALHHACRLITLVGAAGIGKTALSVKFAERTQGEFKYLIWRSLRSKPSIDRELARMIFFLSDRQKTEKDLPDVVGDRISYLIDYLRASRCLLILDNLDAVLWGDTWAGKYQPGYEGYGDLLDRIGSTRHQSCLLVTSRWKPPEIVALEGETLPVRTLQLAGLNIIEGQKLLQDKGLFGSPEEINRLMDYVQGNPLAIKIAATSIRDLFNGNISSFFNQINKPPFH